MKSFFVKNIFKLLITKLPILVEVVMKTRSSKFINEPNAAKAIAHGHKHASSLRNDPDF